VANILSWKLALATVSLSGVAITASANQAHSIITPTLVVKGGVTAVRIIARAGRRDLKLHQKRRATNKRKGRYSSEAGLSGVR
jgi:hypothetical protein